MKANWRLPRLGTMPPEPAHADARWTVRDRGCPLFAVHLWPQCGQLRLRLSRSRPVADASGAPVLRDQGPIGRPGTARPIKASSRTAGYLSVTCDPANMYIHRRCSSRGSRRSRIRTALRQTVAAAAVMGHRIHRWAVARPRRPWRGFPAVTFASPPSGQPTYLRSVEGGPRGEFPCPKSVP